jgi:hypothetical protein
MLPSEQLYTNCRTAIPGAPDQHLMFPAIWNGSVDDTTRIAMASSQGIGAGQPVTLRIEMKQAKLFGLELD